MLVRARNSFADRSRWVRELIILGLALLAGLILVPLAIWFVGDRVLGPYTHGSNTHAGPLALLGDFFVGLAHGSPTFWLVATGPALIIVFARVAFVVLRHLPARPAARNAPPSRN